MVIALSRRQIALMDFFLYAKRIHWAVPNRLSKRSKQRISRNQHSLLQRMTLKKNCILNLKNKNLANTPNKNAIWEFPEISGFVAANVR